MDYLLLLKKEEIQKISRKKLQENKILQHKNQWLSTSTTNRAMLYTKTGIRIFSGEVCFRRKNLARKYFCPRTNLNPGLFVGWLIGLFVWLVG